MKTKKVIFFLFVFLSYIPVLAQVDTAWVRRYNGPGNGLDVAYDLAVDDSGNVYVSGLTDGVRDNYGNLFDGDYATIKYSPAGDILWVRRYDGPGNGWDEVRALAVDDSGNVYVTGYSSGSGTSYDFATIKYSPAGDTLWVRRYDGPGDSTDVASAIVVDDSGNVYVTGRSAGTGTSTDYATIKYASNGDTLWVRRYNGPGNGDDQANALAVDKSGNVYVTGRTRKFPFSDWATIKYSPNGDTLWVRRYHGSGESPEDEATSLAVDDSGSVYVTGTNYGSGTFLDYITIKYAANGDTLWVRRYNGPANGDDGASALALDSAGHVYVTGSSYSWGTTEWDYATIKYAPNGNTLWVRRYNGPGNYQDVAFALALDSASNVYVTGLSAESSIYPYNYGYITIKYAPNGDTLWVRRYNGLVNYKSDHANALAVDNSGNVYVTGRSDFYCLLVCTGDFATIKYAQFCLAKPGDTDADSAIQASDAVTLVNYIFESQPAPNPLCRGDANADGSVSLTDIVYLINFIFKSGPAPQKSRECCL